MHSIWITTLNKTFHDNREGAGTLLARPVHPGSQTATMPRGRARSELSYHTTLAVLCAREATGVGPSKHTIHRVLPEAELTASACMPGHPAQPP